MAIDRIVSFFPSATELIYEFGMEELLYGVTHECNFPPSAKSKLRVINSKINSERSSKKIDEQTCRLLNSGEDIFILDEKNLLKAKPDLIIAQETCEICAAHSNQVNKALKILPNTPIIFSINPHNIMEILNSVLELGKILSMEHKATFILNSLENRIDSIKNSKPTKIPKVLAIEWLEPFFSAGHWVPEMIEIAGGKNEISTKEEHSRKMNIAEISLSDPDIIILMPCGFNSKRTINEYYQVLEPNKIWNGLRAVKNKKVFAVDANSFFSKPSIRIITGIEILAKIFHPNIHENLKIPENSFVKI